MAFSTTLYLADDKDKDLIKFMHEQVPGPVKGKEIREFLREWMRMKEQCEDMKYMHHTTD